MSEDRLKELQRQRALAQEQLAWFDREIAKESGQAPAATPPFAAPGATRPFAAAPSELEATRAADEILARYQKQPATAETDTKRGCYLYFIFALGALVIFAVGGYFIYVNLRR